MINTKIELEETIQELFEPKKKVSRILYFDIETGTAPDYLNFMPDEFSISKVLKDESKIKEAKRKAKEDFLQKCCLSPITGRIIAIGTGDEKSCSIMHEEIMSEKEMLENFWKMIKEHLGSSYQNIICGWNIKSFDLPFLCTRSWKYGIVPEYNIKQRYSDVFIDLTELFSFKYKDSFVSLDTASRFLGFEGKEIQVSKHYESIYKVDKEKALKHLENDIILTRQIANIII